jgi:hypothetical protein
VINNIDDVVEVCIPVYFENSKRCGGINEINDFDVSSSSIDKCTMNLIVPNSGKSKRGSGLEGGITVSKLSLVPVWNGTSPQGTVYHGTLDKYKPRVLAVWDNYVNYRFPVLCHHFRIQYNTIESLLLILFSGVSLIPTDGS